MLRPGILGIALVALPAAASCQQGARWLIRAGDAGVRIVGQTPMVLRERLPAPMTTAPGEFAVHFPRDAAGKPDSLALSVPEGATVAVAVDHAEAAEAVTLEAIGGANYLVTAKAVSSDSAGMLGLVARQWDDDNWYRFVWDRERGQFRLERSISGSIIVINHAPAPPGDDESHQLALQVEGFRMRAFFDDALVLQALDGAHGHGGFATWYSGTSVQWKHTIVERPAKPRPSSALIATDASAVFVAATCAAAGHHHVLELALDRPHALVPLTEAGLELWLLQRPAAPVVVLGDFLGELGHDAIGKLPADGRLQSGLQWPSRAALSGQAALVRALVVSPDGDRLVFRTPSSPLQF